MALAAGCLAVAGTAAGFGISRAAASGPPAYRTAAVTTASVARTLAVPGVLEPVDQATAAFQVAGTVASVPVTQGQQVRAGQTLATLDPALLQQQVSAAQAALTAAQAKLAADESGQSTSATGTASGASTNASGTGSGSAGIAVAAAATSPPAGAGTATTSSTNGPTPESAPAALGGPSATVAGSASLRADQQAVVDAQKLSDADLQIAGAALSGAEGTCTAAGTISNPTPAPTGTTAANPVGQPGRGGRGGSSGPTTTTGQPTTTTTQPTTTTTVGGGTPAPTGGPAGTSGGSGASGGPGTACAAALTRAQAAEQQVAADQQNVARAEAGLARILATQAAAAPTGGSQRSSSPAGTGQTRPASGNPGTATAPATPAQLAGDQAAIDSDDATLAQAEQALSATVLTSPIAGIVASVSVIAGETVASGSSTATITIVNSGSYQTTVSLSTTQVQSVRTGDPVSLTIDGQQGTFHGAVSTIGPVDAASSGFTYPVTIAITSPTGQLPAGSTTRTAIRVAGVTDALVVPTSAVHTAGPSLSFVLLDRNGRETRQRVTVGVVAPVYTQISSGLRPGQVVVLADPSQPVPASNTSATSGGALRGGGGGLAGGAVIRNLLRGSAG